MNVLNLKSLSHEEEMKQLDNIIREKEKKIFELKKKNQNLEKHKFVLNHKIQVVS